ncbi:Type II secretion system (T2SS), protein F (plasmid) [Caballeronia sp. SBC1]|uniref:type II secretion system F family protein n=1 Tax=unclassified Caballeronia TaxID=2646786 RepID=UPI0013E1A82F|nr:MULTISPECIES: type II secretion system F family protein [unclassified Caballeronia]QIE29903.1 Type II secretion system (T2SS), protein F [Caballeronia sp. SBC2]QIN67614.1 Type II secretion system (T2SS), protein F [Caballeronia sp. SBC1]
MNFVDLVTVASFASVIVLGVMVLTVQDLRSKQPEARIRARMADGFSLQRQQPIAKDAEQTADLFNVTRENNAFSRWSGPKLARLRTVAGAKGVRIVIAAAIGGELVAMLMARFMPLPGFVPPLLLVGLPVLAGMRAYSFLVERFRRQFLDGFPDLIDLLVRGVRAGVPVTQMISAATEELPEPLRREFKLMGDSLQIGLDLETVLAAAVQRIEIADFSFFCVCVMLQRETGGQLGETLENLAAIVRTRREIRQKTRALTGEARITTKILSAIPVVVMVVMSLTNDSYLPVLLGTPAGQKLLTYAVISVVVGIFIITKMSKLDTSR